jgi:hypothetical protein
MALSRRKITRKAAGNKKPVVNFIANSRLANDAQFIQRKCDTCGEEDKLQRKESSSNSFFAPSQVSRFVSGLGGSGNSLPNPTNQFFSSRFGQDFSGVKIHTGKDAADSAKAINAHAYTVGNHIVFNENKYQPESYTGKQLLAHELTHVVQQRQSLQPKHIQRALITHPTAASPNFVFEAEAKLYAFSDLARIYGSTVAAITAANPKLKTINVGDHITIPAADYPGGQSAPSGPPQAGVVVSSGTNAINVRWNAGATSNKVGTIVRGKPISCVGGGCWINIADLATSASGVIDELVTLGLATTTQVYGYIDMVNQRLTSAVISTADQDTLARMLWGEQRGQGHDAMVAAAWIVMNRYKGGWGTIGQIVTATNQFQGLVPATAVQNLSGKDLAMWTDAQAIAAGVIGGTIADTTSGYKFFGNGSAMQAKMAACAKSNAAFKFGQISGTNFYYSNGDYTGSCKVE